MSEPSYSLEGLQRYGVGIRVAIIHDWLVVQGGAEKVLDALLQAFPQAEIFTLVDNMPHAIRGRLVRHRVHTSLIQRLPLMRRHYRYYLPLMPYAIEQFDLSRFDLVISSSHSIAKGVITHPGQRHICYCHTPMRYAWDMKESYLRDAGFPRPVEWFLRRTLMRLRQWDHVSSSQVDLYIANSHNVAARIGKYYRRDASVIHPPVDLETFTFNSGPRENFYLAASRMVAYKRLDLIIEAFRHDGKRRLKVVGDGPERNRLERLADGADNIELLGYQSNDSLQRLMASARGFVFAADEDFGILPVEAQACGPPVIAYGGGGALETVVSGTNGETATGTLFAKQDVDHLLKALQRFESCHFDPEVCRRQAERFSQANFWSSWLDLLQEEHDPA